MTNTQELTPGTNGKTLMNETIGQLESRARRGATAISEAAHRAAEQIDRTTDYLQRAGQQTLDTAAEKSRALQETVRRNPIPIMLGATAIGVAIGFFLRGSRRTS